MKNIFKIMLAAGALSLTTLASANCYNYQNGYRNYNDCENYSERGDYNDCRGYGRMGFGPYNFHKGRHHDNMWSREDMGPRGGMGPRGSMGPRGFENDFKIMTIKDVLSSAKDGDIVRVKGQLTKYVSDEKFLFVDNDKNSMTVKLDEDRDWSYIEKDMPIEVIAKVDNDDGKKILKVKRARPDMPMDRDMRRGPKGFNGSSDNNSNNISN